MKVTTGRNFAVLEMEPGESGNENSGKTKLVVSYSTPVFEMEERTMGGKVIERVRRLWDGFSKTTMQHINSVFSWMDKEQWDGMQVGQWYKIGEE